MTDQNIKRIGFCCKYLYPDQTLSKKLLEEKERPFNGRVTTKAWLERQSSSVAEAKLEEVIDHNINSFKHLIKYTGSLSENLRMVRLGSDILPFFTEATWKKHYTVDRLDRIRTRLFEIGDLARSLDVRLSMHPGQFTVLASDRDEVVESSIEEFEYHTFIATAMGYGKKFQDFKINVHISGKRGPDGIKSVLKWLSPESRRMITIENEEMRWGLESTLELEKDVALVLDVHHHFIHSNGEYIRSSDDRWKRVVDSWRGVRPAIHYSISREDYLKNHCNKTLPDYQLLIQNGYKKAKLRAHSDYCWNQACNDWVLEFWDDSDIIVEAKCKNLASAQLHKQALQKTCPTTHFPASAVQDLVL